MTKPPTDKPKRTGRKKVAAVMPQERSAAARRLGNLSGDDVQKVFGDAGHLVPSLKVGKPRAVSTPKRLRRGLAPTSPELANFLEDIAKEGQLPESNGPLAAPDSSARGPDQTAAELLADTSGNVITDALGNPISAPTGRLNFQFGEAFGSGTPVPEPILKAAGIVPTSPSDFPTLQGVSGERFRNQFNDILAQNDAPDGLLDVAAAMNAGPSDAAASAGGAIERQEPLLNENGNPLTNANGSPLTHFTVATAGDELVSPLSSSAYISATAPAATASAAALTTGRLPKGKVKKLAVIATEKRKDILTASKAILKAFEPVLSYDPKQGNWKKEPDLYIDDPEYKASVAEIVSELKKLNSFLDSNRAMLQDVADQAIKLAKPFNKAVDRLAEHAPTIVGLMILAGLALYTPIGAGVVSIGPAITALKKKQN